MDFNCSLCNATTSSKEEKIKELPKVLMFHLQRSDYSTGEHEFVNDSVKIQKTITHQGVMYDIRSVIVWENNSDNGEDEWFAHYYTYCFLEINKDKWGWIKIDDKKVDVMFTNILIGIDVQSSATCVIYEDIGDGRPKTDYYNLHKIQNQKKKRRKEK